MGAIDVFCSYVDNMNKQIAGTDMDGKSLDEIVVASWNGGSPTPVFNNAAQVCGLQLIMLRGSRASLPGPLPAFRPVRCSGAVPHSHSHSRPRHMPVLRCPPTHAWPTTPGPPSLACCPHARCGTMTFSGAA